jgi:hypothetical protein
MFKIPNIKNTICLGKSFLFWNIGILVIGICFGFRYSSFGFFADLGPHRFEVKLRYFLATIESFTKDRTEPILAGPWASASSHRTDHP